MNHNVVQLIQGLLAPGIMITASSLLLLGMNNKYSLIVNRIRLLKEEKRKLFDEEGNSDEKSNRISNIELQISHLIHRISMVRNTVFSYSASIVMFIVSCVLIGINIDNELNTIYWISLGFFYTGLAAVLTGIVFAAIEVWKGYRIVRIEISEIYKDIE